MRFIKSLAPIAAAAALVLAPVASQAGLVIELTDGVTSTLVYDNAIGDGYSGTGVISYLNFAFKSWEITFAMATSTTDPLAMHLTASVVGNAGDGILTLKVTNTDLVAGSSPMVFSADGGGSGVFGSTASWASYVDDSNAMFGEATQIFSSSGYGTGAGAQTVSLSGLYSATLVTTFDYTGVTSTTPQGSSLDVGMRVPEPTSIALVGLALVGLGVSRRRKG